MKKLLVIGASGLLGSKLMLYATGRFDAVGTYNPAVDGMNHPSMYSLDIGSKEEVECIFERIQPEIIILTAAMTNLDACEANPALAHIINAKGPEHVAGCCKRLNAKLLQVSSVYVFDGSKKGRYTEEDVPNPISVYAESKLAGERAISSVLSDFIIARPAVMYGWPPIKGKDNFVTTLIDRLRSNQPAKLFDDQYASPTFSDDFARALLDLSLKDSCGILNVSGPDCISRLTCGNIVAKVFNLDASLIVPVSYKTMPLPAKRPANACLDVSKVENLLKRKMVSFEEGVRIMMQQEKS